MRWELVGFSSHPIPDSPAVVAAQAERLRSVASSMRAQIERMPTEEQASSLVWDSAAAEGFKAVVAQLPRDLGKLEVRYERVAEALEGFHEVLVRTKGQAEAAVGRAARAQEAIEAARAGIERMADHARAAQAAAERINAAAEPGTPPVSPEPWSGPDHHALLRAAEDELALARGEAHEAVDAFARSGDATADAVASAADDDLKNDDSVWGTLKQGASWVVDRLPVQEIAQLAGSVAAVAGVLAILPIPFLQPLAAAVAVGASVIAFGAQALVMLDKAHDGVPVTLGDWGLLGLAAVGVAGGAAGRLAAGAVRSAHGTASAARAGSLAANRAVQAAAATRAAAQSRHLASVARLQGIQRSNVIVRTFHRVVGSTGRATAAVTRSAGALDDALAAEQAAQAARAAAQVQLDAAEATLAHRQLVEQGIRTGSGTIDAAQVSQIPEDPRLPDGDRNPFEAIGAVIEMDVTGVLDGPGHPILREGAARGAAIRPEPIGPG